MDKSVGGPDASFSLNEIEFKRMVEAVRESESALGKVNYKLTENQKAARNYSRSLYIAKSVKKGDVVTKANLKSVRPGYGMHPKYLPELIGKRFTKDCEAELEQGMIYFSKNEFELKNIMWHGIPFLIRNFIQLFSLIFLLNICHPKILEV